MATLVSALNTDFTPTVGDFIVQATGGPVDLLRQNGAGAGYAKVGSVGANEALIVSNPVAGAVYRFVAHTGSPSVRADQ